MIYIATLYDPYIHNGLTVYHPGQPFSYFAYEFKIEKKRPAPLIVSDLNMTASPFTPGESSPVYQSRESSPLYQSRESSPVYQSRESSPLSFYNIPPGFSLESQVVCIESVVDKVLGETNQKLKEKQKLKIKKDKN